MLTLNNLKTKLPALLSILFVFVCVESYDYWACNKGFPNSLVTTSLLLIPAFILLEYKKPWATLSAALTILPFALYISLATCEPYVYKGGGAPMTEVPAFLFGWPASILIGILVGNNDNK